MNKKLIILTITVTFILPLLTALTIYQYNKLTTTKSITMTIIESDNIDKNEIMTTLEDSKGQQYDVYSTCIETKGNKVSATINNQNEIIDYKVIK